ncbi:MAG: hypothetical protein CR982_07385 [Candidatus Cloacimonadota bacterium]|nr:MAG: hypothetical protein CR982_07385 [Candidatus Cloacimonadota bacterium]PIE79461.1 MAG: hypothetical protein CSA15_03040 [Candidatus Delongbacteria bacterium]
MNGFNAECVFSSEWDKEAAKTYFENYGIKLHGDITKIKEKSKRRVTKKYKSRIVRENINRESLKSTALTLKLLKGYNYVDHLPSSASPSSTSHDP